MTVGNPSRRAFLARAAGRGLGSLRLAETGTLNEVRLYRCA
jgi:hypothetical protein